LVYGVVGLCAIYHLVQWKSVQRRWAMQNA
jgi:uncharacterized membrane protein YuzA (DUF378 family)